MNKAESERLGSYLEQQGYQQAESAEESDLVVLNSCMIRQSAENRVINKLHSLKPLKKARAGVTMALTGCMVNSDVDSLRKSYPHIDHFFKAGDYPPWMKEADWLQALPLKPSPSTFVTIIQGCNNFCSYCIVPYRRGRERSRPLTDIVCEVRELVKRGVKEVILLGQNVDSYGHDLPDKPELADLLEELNPIEGLARIRFLTNHPKDMNSRLIKAIASLDKVCPDLNIPVQSGSDEILEAMRRGYKVEHYRQLIEEIRRNVPEVGLINDIIVGFPPETDEQFQQTYDLLSELRFDTVHVAAYSPRPGTIASRKFEDNIPIEVKKERLARVEKLQETIATEINSKLMDRTVEILVEGKNKGKWQGRTRTGKLVFFNSNDDYFGQLVNVRINRTSPWSLQGTVV